jgi:hypothetical protein
MARFVVDLGDIEMSRDAQAEIAGDIQKAVLAHIARLEVDRPFVTKFPKEWWGLVMHDHLEGLIEREKLTVKAFQSVGIQ